MEDLKRHEIFEIEAIELMNSSKLLEPLVFGGGTMLRLCYELDRYSVDLDFWFLKKRDERQYFAELKSCLGARYEITDACMKRNTLLVEVRSSDYPRRLKLEVRRGLVECDWQERIAFSKYGTKQVMVKAHTLDWCMKKKVQAALDRKEIRDIFDMEFLVRRGVSLPEDKEIITGLIDIIKRFKPKDFKVTLGSYLGDEQRKYYIAHGFEFLMGKMTQLRF